MHQRNNRTLHSMEDMCLQNEETHYFPAQRKEEEIHSKAHLHKTSEHRGQKENPKSFQTEKRLLIRI